MLISHVRWKLKRVQNLIIMVVGESEELDAEKFIWIDLRNIWIISGMFHGKAVQFENACKYQPEKSMKISLVTALKFRDEKDIQDFLRFIDRYFLKDGS